MSNIPSQIGPSGLYVTFELDGEAVSILITPPEGKFPQHGDSYHMIFCEAGSTEAIEIWEDGQDFDLKGALLLVEEMARDYLIDAVENRERAFASRLLPP